MTHSSHFGSAYRCNYSATPVLQPYTLSCATLSASKPITPILWICGGPLPSPPGTPSPHRAHPPLDRRVPPPMPLPSSACLRDVEGVSSPGSKPQVRGVYALLGRTIRSLLRKLLEDTKEMSDEQGCALIQGLDCLARLVKQQPSRKKQTANAQLPCFRFVGYTLFCEFFQLEKTLFFLFLFFTTCMRRDCLFVCACLPVASSLRVDDHVEGNLLI